MAQRPRPIPTGVRQARSLLYPAASDGDRTPIEVPRAHPHEDEPTRLLARPRPQRTGERTGEDDQPTPVATRSPSEAISSAAETRILPIPSSGSAETKKVRPIPTSSSATTEVRPIPAARRGVEDATERIVVRGSRHAPARHAGAGSSAGGHALDEEDARTATTETDPTEIIKPKSRSFVTFLWIVGIGAWVLVLVAILARCSTPP